jgi:hypothetical protein
MIIATPEWHVVCLIFNQTYDRTCNGEVGPLVVSCQEDGVDGVHRVILFGIGPRDNALGLIRR